MPISKKPAEKKRKKITEGGLKKTDADKDIGLESVAVAKAKKAKSDEQRKLKKEKKLSKKKIVEEKIVTEEPLDLPNFEEDDAEEEDNSSQEPLDLPSIDEDTNLKNGVDESQKVETSLDKSSKPYMSISGGPQEDDNAPKVSMNTIRKNRGVVYVSHIPHGFYEKQMREFFGQFGSVTNLRLGRSKKTGRSCGYAFVEFKYKEVANVVSETMNNYLMFDKILKCVTVPSERCSPAMFKGKIKPNRPPGKTARVNAKKIHNSEKCDETIQKRQVRQIKKVKNTLKKLKEAGIEYNFKIAEMSSVIA